MKDIKNNKTQEGFWSALISIGGMGSIIGLLTLPLMFLLPETLMNDSSALAIFIAFSTYTSVNWFHWLSKKWDVDPDDLLNGTVLTILSISLSLLTAIFLGIFVYIFRGSKEPFLE